ncbi:putative carboxymethylenebutenolidase [Cyberlindnera fabianii]|uniref:Putative carboxymethylenebutenolidase n=1 Tax=Cyberlindnera fabianii TaxID=36022 RepID=A0A1V2L2K2_CYBFA|nr:putative carboxymethylenebutenolidase [Cyberlindnera fabianii]
MLITESYHDVKTSYGTTLRLYTFHPKIPNYPLAKFPGVIVYSEIYQVTGPVARPEPLAYDAEGTDKGNLYKLKNH